MAGQSTKEVPRRRRVKAENPPRTAGAHERGTDGEHDTALALAALPSEEWTVFHDIRWPGGRYVNVDHVVVGPGGVFVIDSKNWSGDIQVRRDIMRQNGRLRDKALSGAGEAAVAIGGLVPDLDPHWVHPVLCFARDESIMGWGRSVMVCSTSTIVPMLLTHPAVLSPTERQTLSRQLGAWSRALSQAASAGPVRRTPPRHSSAAPAPVRADPRAAKRAGRRKSSKTAGALVPFGALAVGAAVVATNSDLARSAGQLLDRVFG